MQDTPAFPARPLPAEYVAGVRAGDRGMLARAITLIESTRPADARLAQELLQALLPYANDAHRIGITGVPGAGKSTTIDQFGLNLVAAGHKVAVLAVDPSSSRTGGSILGDKTRMGRLALSPSAYIRPSPSSGTLGGVTRKTREIMTLLEAAGYDIVLVETVGVGQSEIAVAGMVDIFVVLLLPGGGDELQGLKKGIIEIADIIAINKADGDNVARALQAASEYRAALQILTPHGSPWLPPVLTVSGRDNLGLDTLWSRIGEHRGTMTANGEFTARRRRQAVDWMRAMIHDRLAAALSSDPSTAAAVRALETDVREGNLLPSLAASQALALIGF